MTSRWLQSSSRDPNWKKRERRGREGRRGERRGEEGREREKERKVWDISWSALWSRKVMANKEWEKTLGKGSNRRHSSYILLHSMLSQSLEAYDSINHLFCSSVCNFGRTWQGQIVSAPCSITQLGARGSTFKASSDTWKVGVGYWQEAQLRLSA